MVSSAIENFNANVTAGRINTGGEWLAYFRAFHEQLPNANDLFTVLRTRSNDTSYSLLAKAVASNASNVLDLGCGDGNLIDELLAHLPKASIYGVDVASPQITIAKRRYSAESRVHLETADALHLPFEDGFFDCVVAHQFLNFLPAIHPYLREVARVLKPDGRLLAVSNRGWQSDRAAMWVQINEAALEAVHAIYPQAVWPKMGDPRMYREEGIVEIFEESELFDPDTISVGFFTSSALLTPERVEAIYNRLYFYALLPEKKAILEAVRARAEQRATKGDLLELALPFRLISARTKSFPGLRLVGRAAERSGE